MKPLFVAVFALALASPAAADSYDLGQRTLDTRGIHSVRFSMPVGRLVVSGAEGHQLTFSGTARTGLFFSSRHVRDITLRAERHGDVLELGFDNVRENHGPKVTARIQVPHDLALLLDVQVGAVDVSEVDSDVDVQMGVGKVWLDLPQQSVRQGNVSVGVGGASVHMPGHRALEGCGFVGRELSWDDGPGAARVSVSVGVGDAQVHLR